ncbi:pilin major subunit VirB2 [Mesorhizobium sp. B283B1A]|uniref:Type IV secretory pathway, VirB2 component (Pilin) n=4 Tax=Phyllobacteriaceae TaxID=69277 RepID=L0KTD3_MESAW|nr:MULTISPECIES: pilin major subunit VirB2 [Mesorhizobium]TPJ40441.1 pilin major subunit VirB2 [Mesorhizobium sp. B2-6-6]ADV14693.1 Conjugal transfer protein TrbC [Mesorhizobium ciceri biovar biserrulae WSM1271]AEH90579.1 Conjugal transfer protein TrbC [Mesorhizobium opportunistum WSM2075]AGB47950.1 type IV secretory pathway, VirB2 component (pilin) [Mesorhizobium australicum WSM2073]ARP67180.1 type IV secretion system protein VirB2 [Mesorhizobium sp. WSM1497]
MIKPLKILRALKTRVPSPFSMLRMAAEYAPAAAAGVAWTVFSSGPAAAQVTGGTDPAKMVQNICTFILGPFGQSLAVLGLVAIGISWMFGRASLGLVAGVVGGIVIMFGASFLGKALIGAG